LLKKHRFESETEIIQLRTELEEKLQVALNHDDILAKLEGDKKNQEAKVSQSGANLHKKRQEIKAKVEESVQKTLAHVGMANAKLEVFLNLQSLDKASNRGMDSVQFLFSANKGQALQPIHKVAS